MSCTTRCKTAGPGGCCCECQGEHHGEAAPVQQKRLALAGEIGDIIHDGAVAAGIAEAVAPLVEVHPEDCAGPCCLRVTEEPGAGIGIVSIGHPRPELREEQLRVRTERRMPHDRTIEGRTVHLSPGYRYTLDNDTGEPIWFAYFGATHTSAVDPDVAARKALGL